MNENKFSLKENYAWFIAFFFALLAFIVFILLHLDESQRTDPVVTIRYVDNISTGQAAIIKNFNKQYAGRIHVQAVNLPFTKFSTNDRKEILARALRNKSDQIDVIALDVIWGARFAKWALPLNEFWTDSLFQPSLPQALNSCIVNDTLISLPLYIDVTLMYYRQDLLLRVPGGRAFERRLLNGTTWKDFHQFLAKARKVDMGQYLFAAKDFEGLVCNLFETIPESKIHELEVDVKINLDQPAYRAGVDHLLSFRRENSTPDSAAYFDEYQCYLWGVKNNSLFIKGWPGLLRHNAVDLSTDSLEQYLKIAPVPRVPGQKKSAILGGWNLMISRFSMHRMEALTFVRYARSVESQKILFEQSGYIPVNRKIYSDSVFLTQHPMLNFYLQQVQRGKHRPYRIDYTRMSDILAFFLHQAFIGKRGIRESLQHATEQINANSIFIK